MRRNPWLANNPFMSMWMSGANTLFGAARGHAHRQATRLATDSVTRAVDAWARTMTLSPAPARKRAAR